MARDDAAGFALYVHWPFCAAKCPYCDFNVHIRPQVDQAAWRDGLLRELDHFAERVGPRTLTSIAFGGGTPSLMAPATVAAIIERTARHFTVAATCEIGLEANPAERARFADLRAAGVRRLSLGVQSFETDALRFLGRDHDGADAAAALAEAQRLFPRVSFDLIYARPGQSVAAWREELTAALARASGHLSLYQLTIENGTAFGRRLARGALAPLDEDGAADLYAATQELCEAAGLPAYEVSNHATPGHESRHNATYWRGGDYIGIGPGAHGRLTLEGARHATSQIKRPEDWLAAVALNGHGSENDDVLALDEAMREALMFGLRLVSGIERTSFRTRFGVEVEAALDVAETRVLIDDGLLALDAAGLRATATGRPLLDALLGRILL